MIKKVLKSSIKFVYAHLYKIKIGNDSKLSFPIKFVNSKLGSINIGAGVDLSSGTIIMLVNKGANLKIGNHIRVAHDVQICCAFEVEICSNVNIGPYVYIADHNHKYEDPDIPIIDQEIDQQKKQKVKIDEGCWIGTKVTIAGNVTIGKHCVVII